MNIKKIVEHYLKTNNYEGLCNHDCGCDIKDLMPCDSNVEYCKPAYICKCINCKNEFYATDKNEDNCNDCN